MKKGIPLLLMGALFVLALFAPAAMAQDDDNDDDDDDAATASPTATATAGAADDDDYDDRATAAAGGALPRTGGPALIAPVAGALLLGSGIIAGVVGLRRNL